MPVPSALPASCRLHAIGAGMPQTAVISGWIRASYDAGEADAAACLTAMPPYAL